jgi:fructosamine-3-kinase
MYAFGAGLAALHNIHQEHFGWEISNYIGNLPQSNTVHPGWASFYLNERLKPQLKMAVDSGLLRPKDNPGDGNLQEVLKGLFNDTSPALLHGDLWNGNYLISHTGEAYLIDPAVYRGHAEVDLAMSRLFGGFGQSFYKGYHSVRPRQHGADEREQIYQLYYLLVHLNLFGNSYRSAVKSILNRFFAT